MKNISINEQVRRYVNRWIFDCANRLITEEGMERKRAFAQAKKALHLLEKLGMGEARFEYLKANGELRKALRLQYYACTYVIFDYLRSNGQLDRTERIFDKEVMRNLGKTLRMLGTELYDEDRRN